MTEEEIIHLVENGKAKRIANFIASLEDHLEVMRARLLSLQEENSELRERI